MIVRIQDIQNFGIFGEYISSSDLNDFKKYNLIYGWNGSGKSTLSKLFYSIKDKKLPIGYESSNFRLKIGEEYFESSSLPGNTINIHVFNDQFVKDNIDWDNLVKCLLYVSKGKVEDKAKLIESQTDLHDINKEVEDLEAAIASTHSMNEAFLTDTAKEIKKQFEVLKTNDNYYINYTKARLRPLIEHNAELKKEKSLISEKKAEELRSIAKLEFLEKIDIELPEKIDITDLENRHSSINLLLKTDIVSKSIDSLQKDKAINLWVEQGVALHENSNICKYCENEIKEERKNELNAHFNDNFKKLKEQVIFCIEDLKNHKRVSEILPANLNIYPFLKEKLYKEDGKFRACANKINKYIESLEKTLNTKLENLFDTSIKPLAFPIKLFEKYNNSISQLSEIFASHNSTTDNFEKETSESKKKLELAYAHKELIKYKYFEKIKSIKDNETSIVELKEKLPVLEATIKVLEASLTNEILGATEFNIKLSRFLNHNDISLEFDKENKGYKILRKKGARKEIAKNLSEGEKTALSFVFFMTKLEEDKERLKNGIVIIDDPISSFDSNHLFNAYSYVRNICNTVGQLIVLTHNFNFFRLIRDWIKEKDKNRKDESGNLYKEINHRIYNIETLYDMHNIRQSILINADDSLLQYNSEYHFLFSKMYANREKKRLQIDECFLISNIARKVLEIFLNFKFPRKRTTFSQLLIDAMPNEKDRISRERIYRFINKYSHGDSIESFDGTIDNIISESDNVVKDILKLIETLDKKHFEELKEIVLN